jgi:probable HAF family extracellular repeat protein
MWEKGRMRNLGAPAGLSSTALGINDSGQIVGFAQSRSLDHRALLWQDGHLYDVNTLLPSGSGWKLSEARDINRQGQIVGVGTFRGVQGGFLLNPRNRKRVLCPGVSSHSNWGPSR